MGRSGSGKGTQAKLLEQYIKEQDAEKHPFFYVETGARFRHFIEGDKLSNKLAFKILNDGGRQPDFLAIWIWAHVFLENMTGREHLIIDGTPRSHREAAILDTAMKFYGREKPFVIHIKVSREASMGRMVARGRSDDNTNAIQNRMDWYDKDVLPALTFFQDNDGYNVIEVNGEQSVEEVSKEMFAKIKELS